MDWAFTLERVLGVMLVLVICLSFGEVVNRWLFSNSFKLPVFLTAMLVGIFFTELADKRTRFKTTTRHIASARIALMNADLDSFRDDADLGLLFREIAR